jgi:hypothetical protein
MAANPKRPAPFRFGPPEKTNWMGIVLFSVFVLAALAGIGWMIMSNPNQRKLVCNVAFGVAPSLNAFGRCTEE